MTETTETIGRWADETFGEGSVAGAAMRLLDEVAELCVAAGVSPSDASLAVHRGLFRALEKDHDGPDALPGEVADCAIVLHTIAWKSGADLASEVDAKMGRNRKRRWRRTGDGCGQHIKEG